MLSMLSILMLLKPIDLHSGSRSYQKQADEGRPTRRRAGRRGGGRRSRAGRPRKRRPAEEEEERPRAAGGGGGGRPNRAEAAEERPRAAGGGLGRAAEEEEARPMGSLTASWFCSRWSLAKMGVGGEERARAVKMQGFGPGSSPQPGLKGL